jgi:hypothetical protein
MAPVNREGVKPEPTWHGRFLNLFRLVTTGLVPRSETPSYQMIKRPSGNRGQHPSTPRSLRNAFLLTVSSRATPMVDRTI